MHSPAQICLNMLGVYRRPDILGLPECSGVRKEDERGPGGLRKYVVDLMRVINTDSSCPCKSSWHMIVNYCVSTINWIPLKPHLTLSMISWFTGVPILLCDSACFPTISSFCSFPWLRIEINYIYRNCPAFCCLRNQSLAYTERYSWWDTVSEHCF